MAFTVDEPVAVGGNDTGPGPYEYLLAALGARTYMILRMYAENMNLPLTRVRANIKSSGVHTTPAKLKPRSIRSRSAGYFHATENAAAFAL